MTMTRPMDAQRRGGFSLVEVAISVLLVGGLFIVAMNMAGASQVTQTRYAEREQALLLAEALLSEAMQLPYEDADETGLLFGPEVGEDDGTRQNFDDVDDYDGWTATPPIDSNGVAVAGADRFTRSVEVVWADVDTPKAMSATESGIKRVTVTVTIGGKTLAELVGYRSSTWPDAASLRGDL